MGAIYVTEARAYRRCQYADLPQAMMMVMMTLSGTLMLMGGTPVRWLKDPMTHQSFACLREAVFGRTMGAIQ